MKQEAIRVSGRYLNKSIAQQFIALFHRDEAALQR